MYSNFLCEIFHIISMNDCSVRVKNRSRIFLILACKKLMFNNEKKEQNMMIFDDLTSITHSVRTVVRLHDSLVAAVE